MTSHLKSWLGLPPPETSPKSPPKKWWIVLRQILGVVLIALSIGYLVHVAISTINQVDWHSFRLRFWPLMAAIGIQTFCIGLGTKVWQLVLRSLGYRLPWKICFNIQTTSNLAKYLPGYAWQVMGKAYLTRRQEIPAGIVGLALVLELAGLLLTGIWVALLTMPQNAGLQVLSQWLPAAWNGGVPLTYRIILLVGIAGLAAAIPGLLKLAARIRGPKSNLAGVNIHPLAFGGYLAVYVAAWLLLGVALGLLLPAVGQPSEGIYVLATFTNAIAFIISLLALFVPSGIGVREGVMVYLLSGRLAGGLAVIIAVLSRLALMAGEVTAFGISRLLRPASPRTKNGKVKTESSASPSRLPDLNHPNG